MQLALPERRRRLRAEPRAVGAENRGRSRTMSRLDHERVAARTPDPVTAGRRIDEPWIRFRRAGAHARPTASCLLSRCLVADARTGRPAPGETDGGKFAGTESAVATYRMCQHINTFGGGVSEVQREVVGRMRLGMKRGRR